MTPPNQHRKAIPVSDWEVGRSRSLRAHVEGQEQAPASHLPAPLHQSPASISAGYVPESLAVEELPSCSVAMGTDCEAGCQGCLFSNFALCFFWQVFAASRSQRSPLLWLGSNHAAPGSHLGPFWQQGGGKRPGWQNIASALGPLPALLCSRRRTETSRPNGS